MEELNKTQNVGAASEESAEPKTYTQEEVDKLLQAETDRRVTSALKKQEQKNANAIREAQKLAAMNESQKYEYQLQQREQQIIEREQKLALLENENAASKILSEKGLSLDLVKFVVATEAEEMDANIKALEKAFKASVKQEVEKRLGSAVPKKNLETTDSINKDMFKKMSMAERQELAATNPELYKQLRK